MAGGSRKYSAIGETALSFNLTGEQVKRIMRIRDQMDMTTGELVRKACETVSEEKVRRAAPRIYDRHLTVLMRKELKRRLEKLASSAGLSISDIVRIACEDVFRKHSGK